jgi:hypothetical protein
MNTVLREHWITALSVLAAGFLIFVSVAGLRASDPEYVTNDRVVGVVAGLGALALLGGLWGLRSKRLELWAANALIVPALIVVAMFFWLFLVPLIVAAVLLYAGVIKRGLPRELGMG